MEIVSDLKKCHKCLGIKYLSDFGETQKNKDGYKHWCKKCLAQNERERRVRNGDVIRKQELKRRTNNFDARKEQERRAGIKRRSNPGYYEDAAKKARGRNQKKHLSRINICRICGKIFHPEFGKQSWKQTCSVRCSAELYKIGKRRKSSAYKAKKRMAVKEFFDPFEVFERDKWHCQFCNVRTSKKLRGTYHDNAPELDHIIPIAKGGEHSKKNTQCLCRKCNGKKGSKEKGQLRLFG